MELLNLNVKDIIFKSSSLIAHVDFFSNYAIIIITKTTRPGVFGQHGEF